MARLEFSMFVEGSALLARNVHLTQRSLRIETAVLSYTDMTKMSRQLTPIELRSAANCGDAPTLNAHQIIGFLLKRQFVAGSPGPCRSGLPAWPLRRFDLEL
jgi:hypothetical protein